MQASQSSALDNPVQVGRGAIKVTWSIAAESTT